MAQQSVPLITGGQDSNRRIGNIFILDLRHPNEAAREAARMAALAGGLTEKDLETRSRLCLFPEVIDDPELREHSREALACYLKLTPFVTERYIWNKQLDTGEDERFIDPERALREKSGRAAMARAAASRSEVLQKQKAEEELALAESMRVTKRVEETSAESAAALVDELDDVDAPDPEPAPARPSSGVEMTAEEAAELGFPAANVGTPAKKAKKKK